ncbi:MAG TPA: M23 family metallopeptidase [Actinomycetota bacterium]|nr:M23 family metallopeptidase [Actinomycetota bacterium]
MSLRIDQLKIGGRTLGRELLEMLIGEPVLEYTMDGVSQLTFKLSDPTLAVLKLMKEGARVQFDALTAELAAVDLADEDGTPVITCKARALGPQKLRDRTGALVRKNTSWTTFAQSEAASVGMGFIGQSSPKQTIIERKKAANAGEKDESSWDAIQRGAGEVGFIAFEAENILYFGKPSWLVARHPAVILRYPTARAGELQIVSIPELRRTKNNDAEPKSGSVSFIPSGLGLLPGRGVRIIGIPTFEDLYIVTELRVPIGSKPPEISLSEPVDPKPPAQATPEPGSGDVRPGGGSGQPAPPARNDSGLAWNWPVVNHSRITSRFGEKRERAPGYHTGIDIGVNNVAVYPSRPGHVKTRAFAEGYGNYLILDHGGGWTTLYAHLRSIFVGEGQLVDVNVRMAQSGATGIVSGPHLHFEIRKGRTYLDPLPYLSGEAGSPAGRGR